ncbi:uncharacterized protein ACB057_012040 [Neosynchiropus ocellatus]
MTTVQVLSLTLLSVLAASAQVFMPGPCPRPEVQRDFDVAQYLGTWYGIRRLPHSFQKGQCSTATYSLQGPGVIGVLNAGLLDDGTTSTITGSAFAEDPSEPAKLLVAFDNVPTPPSPYWVLSTDYDGFSVVYSCKEVEGGHRDSAWIMSRQPVLSSETLAEGERTLASVGVRVDELISTNQDPEYCGRMSQRLRHTGNNPLGARVSSHGVKLQRFTADFKIVSGGSAGVKRVGGHGEDALVAGHSTESSRRCVHCLRAQQKSSSWFALTILLTSTPVAVRMASSSAMVSSGRSHSHLAGVKAGLDRGLGASSEPQGLSAGCHDGQQSHQENLNGLHLESETCREQRQRSKIKCRPYLEAKTLIGPSKQKPSPPHVTMKLSLLLAAFFLPLVRAQVPHWGPCPEPTVQTAFNLRQFMGRWYEVAKLPAQFEKGRCIETNFTLRTDTSFRAVSSELWRGELRKVEGVGVVEDPKNPAKLGISFSYVLPYSPYWILSTDYVNSALVYSCTDILRLFHVDFAWILSRSRTLPESTIQKSLEVFSSNNIDVTRMVTSKQQGCDKTL